MENTKFDLYYKKIYGDRWDFLREALLCEVKHSLFCPSDLLEQNHDKTKSGEWMPTFHPCLFNTKQIIQDPAFYYLDLSSALAPYALQICPGEKILDLCAAPGGKTITMASLLNGRGEIIANDRSPNRIVRLKNVVNNYLNQTQKAIVKIESRDSLTFCLLPGVEYKNFDKILLDAPCSSERHVLSSPEYLAEWKEGRVKNLSKDQYTMLCGAYQLLRPGGRLVYSTCSINPLENDQVVSKFLKKKRKENELPPVLKRTSLPFGRETEFGYSVMPDEDSGAGPFYLSIIEKSQSGLEHIQK